MWKISGVVASLLIAMFGLGAGAVSAQSTLDEIQARGKLLAGVRFDSPPNGAIDAQGNNVGFGPDIAREFAKHLGVEVEFIQSTSRSRIPLLLNNQVDAIFSAVTPNKTRDEIVDFSHIYNLEESVIMVRKGEATDLDSYYDTAKVAGFMQGSFFASIWRESFPDATIKEYQEFPELVLALAQGKVDVIPAPRVLALGMMEKLDKTADIVLGDVFFQDPQAIVIRENDSDWRDWVNWALQRMWAEGTFQKIYKQHYKTDPTFVLGDAGRLQPGVQNIAEERDPW